MELAPAGDAATPGGPAADLREDLLLPDRLTRTDLAPTLAALRADIAVIAALLDTAPALRDPKDPRPPAGAPAGDHAAGPVRTGWPSFLPHDLLTAADRTATARWAADLVSHLHAQPGAAIAAAEVSVLAVMPDAAPDAGARADLRLICTRRTSYARAILSHRTLDSVLRDPSRGRPPIDPDAARGLAFVSSDHAKKPDARPPMIASATTRQAEPLSQHRRLALHRRFGPLRDDILAPSDP